MVSGMADEFKVRDAVKRWASDRVSRWGLAILFLLHAPWLVVQAWRVWQDPPQAHLLAVLLVAVAAGLGRRWSAGARRTRFATSLGVGLLAADVGLLAGAVLLAQPSLGLGLGALASGLSGWALYRRGFPAWRWLRPVWALSALGVLLSALAGARPTQALERFALDSASRLLDLQGLRHIVADGAIELAAGGRIEQAAGAAVNSFWLVICGAVCTALVFRRSAALWLLLVVSGAFWASVAIAVEVAGLAALPAAWQWNLPLGWPRTAWAYGVAACGIALTVATDQLWSFLLGPIRLYPLWDDERRESFFPGNPLVRWWNRLLSDIPSDRSRSSRRGGRRSSASTASWPRRVVQAPVRIFLAVFAFGLEWCRSRRWKRLPAGALSALAIGGVVVVLQLEQQMSAASLAADYRSLADAGLGRGDTPAVELALRRLAELDSDSPEIRYRLALAAAEGGDRERGRKLMQALAPDDRSGYGPAHLWLAEDLFHRREPDGGPDRAPTARQADLRKAQHHLANYLRTAPDNLTASVMLAQTYLDLGRLDLAERHLDGVAGRWPEMNLLLAQVLSAQGKADAAKSAATKARDHFRMQAEADADKIQPRLQWVRAEVLRGDNATAEAILVQALAETDRDEYRQTLGGLYAAWSDAVGREETRNVARQYELLSRALELVPDQPTALARLAVLATEDGPYHDAAHARIQELLAAGQAPFVVYVVLGSAAAGQGDFETAVLHLERANQLQADDPIVLNNLAWAVAHRDPPDRQRALALLDVAFRQLPNSPELHDTRGQILLAAGRPQEALADLEFALRAFAGRARLHRALASVYEQLGDPALAGEHAALAELGERDEGRVKGEG